MRLRLVVCVLLSIVTSGASVAAHELAPAVEIPGTGTWFPNTALEPPEFVCCDVRGLPAYQDADRRWLFAVTGGLARFDAAAGSVTYFPISPAAPVSGIARIGNAVWLSARERFIHRFEPGRGSSGGQGIPSSTLSIGKSGEVDAGANLAIAQDPFTGDVWAMHFGHLDVFDAKSGTWRSLDGIFAEKGIGEPNVHSVFFEKDAIWVTVNAHSQARGGLLRLPRGVSAGWSLYRKELIGSSTEPERLDGIELYADNENVWAILSPENGFNLVVALFDKARGTWRSYNREQAIPALNQLADAVPRLRWARRADLATRVDKLARDVVTLSGDHPYRWPTQARVPLNQVAAKLVRSFTSHGFLNRPSPGLGDYIVWGGKITADRRNDGTSILLPLKSVYYERLVSALPTKEVVVSTATGMARLNLESRRVTPITPSSHEDGIDRSASVASALFSNGQKLGLCELLPGYETSARLRIVDLTSNVVSEMRLPGKADALPKEVGTVGDQLAVRTEAGTVLTFDVQKRVWQGALAGSRFRAAAFVGDQEPVEQVQLSDGTRVERRANGLWHFHK